MAANLSVLFILIFWILTFTLGKSVLKLRKFDNLRTKNLNFVRMLYKKCTCIWNLGLSSQNYMLVVSKVTWHWHRVYFSLVTPKFHRHLIPTKLGLCVFKLLKFFNFRTLLPNVKVKGQKCQIVIVKGQKLKLHLILKGFTKYVLIRIGWVELLSLILNFCK